MGLFYLLICFWVIFCMVGKEGFCGCRYFKVYMIGWIEGVFIDLILGKLFLVKV